MRRWLRFQFGLRTLLVAMAVLGIAPWVAVQILQRKENQLWDNLDKAKSWQAQSLENWRRIDTLLSIRARGVTAYRDISATEASARERYFNMRAMVESAEREIDAYYGKNLKRKEAAIARLAKSKAKE